MESTMAEITLQIHIGFRGQYTQGNFLTKKIYEIKILPTATLRELSQLIQNTASEAHLAYSPIFQDQPLDTKTVADAGLVDGSILQFTNGRRD